MVDNHQVKGNNNDLPVTVVESYRSRIKMISNARPFSLNVISPARKLHAIEGRHASSMYTCSQCHPYVLNRPLLNCTTRCASVTYKVMRITAIHCTPVRVPRRTSFISSLGTQTHTEAAVVEIETTVSSGIGEISSIWGDQGLGESKTVNDKIAPLVVGHDATRITDINALMNANIPHAEPAKAAVEMALFDAVGRALDVPVFKLLGGQTRDSIPLSHSLSMGPPDVVAAQAGELVNVGYKTIKLKIGQDLDADLQTLAAVRERVGKAVTLRVDANMAWENVEQAVTNIHALQSFGIEMVEQPLGRLQLAKLCQVREQVDVPIMVDESLWTPQDAISCVRADAADVFNVYVSEAGGIQSAAKIFAIAEAAGIPCIIGSMPELGIGTAAQAHLAFAMTNIGFASDLNGATYQADDVIHERFEFRDGSLPCPNGPGLGISLNRAKLDKYRMKST